MNTNNSSYILLKNVHALLTSSTAELLSGYDLLIEGNIIKQIAVSITPPSEATRIIDCASCVVVPGFVNTHHHFYQTLTRNLPAVQDAKLFDWLVYLYEVWKHIDQDAIYTSTQLAIAELLKTGCTTTTDHHYLYPNNVQTDIMELQFAAATELGIRFSPTRGSMSRSKKDGGLPPDSVVQTEEQILVDSERVIKQFHDSSDYSMRKVVLAPCSPFSVSKELMRESARLARKHGVRLHTHLAETSDENNYCERVYGKRPLALMQECEFVGEDVFYAHGIHFNDDELKILADTQTQIAHCPTSNMRLGSGICRVKEMNQLGINVALAVDGSASNDSSDMLGELRQALLLQRVRYGSDALTARQAIKLATENGAKLLNFKQIGKLQAGYAADISIFDLNKIEYAGSGSDSLAALLFCGYNHGTLYTIVNGRIVVEGGNVVGIDEQELIYKANKAAASLLKNN